MSRPPEYFYEYLNMQYVKRKNRASAFYCILASCILFYKQLNVDKFNKKKSILNKNHVLSKSTSGSDSEWWYKNKIQIIYK